MTIKETLSKLNQYLTDAEVGKVVGAPQSAIWRVRNGITKQPSYDRGVAIKNLARSYGIDE
jgi:hypothetical protein